MNRFLRNFGGDPEHILDFVIFIISLSVIQQYVMIQDATSSNEATALTCFFF